MRHALVDIAASIQSWAGKSQHQPFKDAAAEWVAAIETQVTSDLQAVECLERLDEKTDAIKAAKESLCRAMGLEPDMPMVELLQTCEVTFQSLCEITQ